MPINFTVVPVEDAEGSSAAADGGAKADSSVPTVVVEDGDPSQAQDSGTSLTARTAAATLVLFGITTENSCISLSRTYARAHSHTHRLQQYFYLAGTCEAAVCVCVRVGGGGM